MSDISAVRAQTKLDEEAVNNLPRVFYEAFDKHDGRRLAQIMADDVDFVTVGAIVAAGKIRLRDVPHSLAQRSLPRHEAEPLQIAVRFLRPDIAILHWSWTGAGDKRWAAILGG